MSAFPKVASILALITALLLILPAFAVYAAGGADYEIPLSELKKVEKKKTRKAERKRHKQMSQPESSGLEASGDASGFPRVSDKPLSPSDEPGEAPKPQAQEIQQPASPENMHEGGNSAPEELPVVAVGARIGHDPNSYVITGKLTLVKAVISSLEPLLSARCQFRATENGGYAYVPMIKAEGSRYTYAATIPPLADGAGTLRYRIVAVDMQGRVARSQEFVVPVKQSSVTPGWQLDATQVRAALENPRKPLEGFSDVVIADVSPMP